VKLAVVVQRYGQAINGGAELHARYIAEHLARHHDVEVCTTCAADYVTWRNELPAGVERVNGIPVRRFKVRHQRDPYTFGRYSEHVFGRTHSLADELAWLEAEGPASPALMRYIRTHADQYDYWIFFSYRYHHAYYGARTAPARAILVPTAERDPSIGLEIFKPLFRGVRAIMYNSPEERAMIHAAAGNQDVPGVVVGIGSDVPTNPQPGRFRQKHGIRGAFAVYVGRIDENKGCKELFEYFNQYLRTQAGQLSLVLIGNSILPVPSHPRIRHLGFLDDEDKFDAIAASDLLIMPSYFESLSMVALEAWALGKPVLANSRCDVLKGQCIRSNAGLYYDGGDEFAEALSAIEHTRWLSAALGRNGRQFFRAHYDFPVIERKYLDMLARLAAGTPARAMEPLPGWWARRQQSCRPAAEVLAAIPAGPVVAMESYQTARPAAAPAAGANAGGAGRAAAPAPALPPPAQQSQPPAQSRPARTGFDRRHSHGGRTDSRRGSRTPLRHRRPGRS
jgi:glycosyltransferase involved in cell wall biosynthesis